MKKSLKDLKKGDIFFGGVKDTLGHEQKSKRPLLVISDSSFNTFNNYVLVMPLTTKGSDIDDAVTVDTMKNKVTGYVLTQHIAPYYEDFIADRSYTVSIKDFATSDTLEKVSKMYNAIISLTNYSTNKFNQGDIIRTTINGKQTNAVVLSENSFNETHNTIWVAPLIVTDKPGLNGDYIFIAGISNASASRYFYVLTNHIKNIDFTARNTIKSGKRLTIQEIKKCHGALVTFV